MHFEHAIGRFEGAADGRAADRSASAVRSCGHSRGQPDRLPV